MHVHVHMNIHTSFGSIVFALGPASCFILQQCWLEVYIFPAEEKLHSTETNTGAYAKQQISL